MSVDLAALIGQLEAIDEELAQGAIDDLAGALRAGRSGRSDVERSLTQARRAVNKAVQVLRQLDGGSGGDPFDDID